MRRPCFGWRDLAGVGDFEALSPAHPPSTPPAWCSLVLDDETWQELTNLRRRCRDQEQQVDRQEQLILALQRAAEAGGGGGSGGSGRSGADGRGATASGMLVLQQQVRLLEIENSRLTEVLTGLVGSRAAGEAGVTPRFV